MTVLVDAEVHAFLFRFNIGDETLYTFESIHMGNRRNAGNRASAPWDWTIPEIEGATNVTRIAILHTHPTGNPINQGDALWAEFPTVQLDVFAASPTYSGVEVTKYVFGSAAAAGFHLTLETGGFFPTTGAGSELVVNIGTSTNIRPLTTHEQNFWALQSLAFTDNPLPSLKVFVKNHHKTHHN